jgi:hypothetical protein
MNQVAIIFVPAGATPRDYEAALREHFGSVSVGEPPPQAKSDQITDNDQMPLWTWFIPNSRH